MANCRCDQWVEPCHNLATQEDLLCDVCRGPVICSLIRNPGEMRDDSARHVPGLFGTLKPVRR